MGLLKRIVAPGRTPDVRPIGVGNNRRRAWTGQLAEDHAEDFADILWPHNVAVGIKAGIPKMLYALRAHMTAFPLHILLKLDFKNAFNTMSRAAIITACLNEPRWRKFVKFLWVTLSPASHIEGIPDLSWEGLQQGDTWGSAGFCAGLHPDVAWVAQELRKHKGIAVFDMDDGYLAAPPDVVRSN